MKAYYVGGVLWAGFAAALITAMIYLTDGVTSPYYAGLNLVALIAIFFIPYNIAALIMAVALIYIPYVVIGVFHVKSENDLRLLLMNSGFCIGTIAVAMAIRRLGDRTRRSEVLAQVALAREISDREFIIREKSQETAKLSRLSNQFSPQVVEAIRTGGIQLEAKARRNEICSIFIDIVNSTSRVVRVDKDKVHKVISMFLEDTVRILLKYDLTIDKFMGDGILAFSNDPVKHQNFSERTVRAAIEIRDKIRSRQDEYENSWLNQLQIRIGVSRGYANVGFYGNEKLYRCYTAIGPVVNLACRLCSSAEPDQIVISQDVVESLPTGVFSLDFLGKKTLKGFEEDLIKCYSVTGYSIQSEKHSDHSIDCPACNSGTLFLDSNEKGLFVFRCRSCGHILDSLDPVFQEKSRAS